MLYRLLSGIGTIAHLPDAAVAPLTARYKPTYGLAIGGARVAMPLILGPILLGLLAMGVSMGIDARANPSPTPYTASQLAGVSDVHGKMWATISGTINEYFVNTTRNKIFDHSDFLVCDATSHDCMVVYSKKTEAQEAGEVGADNGVTFTGMIGSDKSEVDATLSTLGAQLAGMHVNPTLVLREGQSPASPVVYGTSIAIGSLAVPILIGWLIGYIVFRPAKQQPVVGPGMTGTLPVRISGVLPGPGAGLRTRDMRAEIHLGEPVPGAAADAPLPMDLYWTRGARLWAARLTPGLTQGVAGNVYPLRGRSPAIRVRFGSSRIIIGFGDAASRDAAYEQMRQASWQTGQAAIMVPWQPAMPAVPGGAYTPGYGTYPPQPYPTYAGYPPQPYPTYAGYPPQPYPVAGQASGYYPGGTVPAFPAAPAEPARDVVAAAAQPAPAAQPAAPAAPEPPSAPEEPAS